MRLFGILLIVVNVLAGAGFVYLASQDWQGRQSITASGLRHVLVLQGLPLEPPAGGSDGFSEGGETPFNVVMAGGQETKTVSQKLLEAYFAANTVAAPADGTSRVPLAANSAVTSQLAEVKRVQGLIKGELAKDGLDAAARRELFRLWLLPQAESYEVRTAYLALLSDRDANGAAKPAERVTADFAELEKALDARFAAVLAKPAVSDGPNAAEMNAAADDAARAKAARELLAKAADWKGGTALDESERRTRVAHLLVHLDTDAAWQKRVAAVIGLRHYVKVVGAQALRFADMVQHVDRALSGEQAAFVAQESLLRDQATRNAERARSVGSERLKMQEQKAAADDAVNRRRTQLKELADQLARVKAEVDELLVRQTAREKDLFEVQREVALTLDEVYRLEVLLAAKERERYGAPPK